MHVNKEKWDAFIITIASGDSNYAKKLLLDGINLNERDVEGKTLLMYAAAGRYVDMVMLLLRNDAEINVQDIYGDTPLMIAVLNDRLASVELLLHAGADLHVKNRAGKTAMDIAITDGGLYRHEIIDALRYDPDTQPPCCWK